MAKPPVNKLTVPAPAAAAAAPAATTPSIDADVVDGDTVRMLVGLEGPQLSRVRGQLLEVGADLDAAEANRLIAATFAERA